MDCSSVGQRPADQRYLASRGHRMEHEPIDRGNSRLGVCRPRHARSVEDDAEYCALTLSRQPGSNMETLAYYEARVSLTNRGRIGP